MAISIHKALQENTVEISAPCRIDMGGTLDISTFFYPLRHLKPCTVNMAIDLRTCVRLFPYQKKMVKVTSRGFPTAKYPIDEAPYTHPLGLMFAVATYFRADGVHIDIDSSSPPRSGLGGSSVAGVALVAAFSKILEQMGGKPYSKQKTALLAHVLEASVAGVPCGLQDQLAAVYGGLNVWYWPGEHHGSFFRKKAIGNKRFLKNLERHLLLAYCGIPHVSKNVNNKWVQQFLAGKHRGLWAEIVAYTTKFADALTANNLQAACLAMNRDTAIRKKMTPEVLDETGTSLVNAALEHGCGARFTGAGGGGCLWALGEAEHIDKLRSTWEVILSKIKGACLLDVKIDTKGLLQA